VRSPRRSVMALKVVVTRNIGKEALGILAEYKSEGIDVRSCWDVDHPWLISVLAGRSVAGRPDCAS
jgi:hypothetical protein